jgi:hypothetical protein
MSTEVAKPNEVADRFLQAGAEALGGPGNLLKFDKGKYREGENEVTGHERIAHVGAAMKGWVKFKNGKVVDRRIGRIADGFQPADRDDLGDLDQDKWEEDMTGKPRDPWSLEYYLPFEDPDSGDITTFITKSKGGVGAIGKLFNVFANNVSKGSPTVKLDVRLYRHPQFGEIATPNFPVVAWEGRTPDGVTAAGNADINDEIPM